MTFQAMEAMNQREPLTSDYVATGTDEDEFKQFLSNKGVKIPDDESLTDDNNIFGISGYTTAD